MRDMLPPAVHKRESGGWLVWESGDNFPTVITPWDLEFYENIKSFYPMMGGSSRVGAYIKIANCVGMVKEFIGRGGSV